MDIEYKFCFPNKWTFKMKPIYEFVMEEMKKAKKVLVPFAGVVRFDHSDITYIDIQDNLPKPYIKGDTMKILPKLIKKGEKYDLIVSDPPYSASRNVMLYKNQKYHEITLFRYYYHQLLEDNGIVLEFGFNSNGISEKKGYRKVKLLIVAVGGNHNDFLCLKQIKTQKSRFNTIQKNMKINKLMRFE